MRLAKVEGVDVAHATRPLGAEIMHTLMLTDIAPSATCHLPILCRPPPGARRPDARRAWNLPPNAFAVVAGPSDFMNPLKTQTPFTSTVPTSSSTQSILSPCITPCAPAYPSLAD
jgi:hypothetical protein